MKSSIVTAMRGVGEVLEQPVRTRSSSVRRIEQAGDQRVGVGDVGQHHAAQQVAHGAARRRPCCRAARRPRLRQRHRGDEVGQHLDDAQARPASAGLRRRRRRRSRQPNGAVEQPARGEAAAAVVDGQADQRRARRRPAHRPAATVTNGRTITPPASIAAGPSVTLSSRRPVVADREREVSVSMPGTGNALPARLAVPRGRRPAEREDAARDADRRRRCA